MKLSILAVLVASLLLAGPAEAATTKRCGSLGPDGKRYDPDVGGAGNFDITVRVSTCKTAKAVVRGYDYGQGERVRGFRCRYTQSTGSTPETLVRCTKRGGRVVRWRSAA